MAESYVALRARRARSLALFVSRAPRSRPGKWVLVAATASLLHASHGIKALTPRECSTAHNPRNHNRRREERQKEMRTTVDEALKRYSDHVGAHKFRFNSRLPGLLSLGGMHCECWLSLFRMRIKGVSHPVCCRFRWWCATSFRGSFGGPPAETGA